MLSINHFKAKASPKELETFNRLTKVFSSSWAYEEVFEVIPYESDNLVEIYTTGGNLVTTFNLTKQRYMLQPEDSLCQFAHGLKEFEDWCANNKYR